jgi:predicted DNA-binding transcriptional regulator YafY
MLADVMVQTSARLLALLSLLQMRREWTGDELADRLEVGPRTIRRDIDKLRSLGYPVESARGVAGGYRLGAGGELPPLLLDDAEAVAVAVGLRTAASGSIAGIEETSVRALAKLEQVLPSRLRRRVRALGDATSAFSFDEPQIDADLLAEVAAACRDGSQLRFAYIARDERASQRQTEPSAVVYSGSRWYLVAWDLERDDWRTFRVDRIRGRVRVGGRGRRRTVPGGDAAAYVKDQLQRRGEERERSGEPGRVRVAAPAQRVRQRVPGRYASVEADGAEACIVSTRGAWHAGFVVWMASMDEAFEILGPDELREFAHGVSRRLSAAAGDAG